MRFIHNSFHNLCANHLMEVQEKDGRLVTNDARSYTCRLSKLEAPMASGSAITCTVHTSIRV